MIIVLAGIHKNLRSQTQLRLDEGFLGFDTQQERVNRNNNLWIGVGEPRSNRHLIAHSLTSSLDNGDFNAGAANALALNFYTNDPIIAVVKKNAYVLNRLEQWLSAQSSETSNGNKIIRNKPLLIIDDEADNASINTTRDDLNPTKINGQIRNLLRLFQKSAYVGYTATPFANIFIPLNDDNLFPRDFITNIPAPSNYIGPDKIFGFEPLEDSQEPTDTLPVVHRIDDYHTFVPDRHKRDDQLPVSVPESLKTAIKCFILTCAIRRLRGQGDEHNSMLIHISRFQVWQSRIKELVENVFNFYRMGIEQNNAGIISELRHAFETDVDSYRSYTTTSAQILDSQLSELDPAVKVHLWKEVLPCLHPAATKIQVKEIHGGAKDVLDYQAYDKKYIREGEEAGLSVIAIGGNKLSRGLTLEGLSVSYYLRASKMYDTLMQMGRWFGYRPGYVDLCRLFTSGELNEWFCHITLASEELRKEFNYMSDIAGSTPEQYALKVRTHPGVLQISATNKIRTAVNVNISWSGVLIESYKLSKRSQDINANLDNLNKLISSFSSESIVKKRNFLWNNIPASNIISFFGNFIAPENPIASPDRLAEFILEKQKDDELDVWHVALMSSNSKTKDYVLDDSTRIWMFDRTDDDKNNSNEVYYIRKSHIISPNHEFIDLTDDEYELAKRKTFEQKKAHEEYPGAAQMPNYPNGNLVRNDLEIKSARFPLLLLYLLNPEKAGLPESEKPIVGFAIRFPGSSKNRTITYAVHQQLLDKFEVNEDPEDYDYED
ncbi:MAG TPA: Z1 domain-containing protein [Bacteroidales bacterium]|nr:Z1 domain-containing protein [Bacteroidales bacterium]